MTLKSIVLFQELEFDCPVNFIAYIQIPPRHTIFKKYPFDSPLDYLIWEIIQDLTDTIKQKRENKFMKIIQ